ncbi:hypothetical protein N9L68_04220 [bacterium]|nr:hypothetical protein [bacterium]
MNCQNTINVDEQTVVRCQTLQPIEVMYSYQKNRNSTPLLQVLTQKDQGSLSQTHHKVPMDLQMKKKYRDV